MPEKGEQRERINGLVAVLLVVAALAADFVQILLIPAGPLIGSLISLVVFTFFSGCFFLLGVSYLDRNGATKFVIWMMSFVVEFIPLLNNIPAITLGVVSLILVTRYADGKDSALFKLSRKRRAAMNDQETVAAERRALDYQARDAMSQQYKMVESERNKREE